MHEDLINRASTVIVVSADANRNLYQYAFAKHVAMICKLSQDGDKHGKPLIVVSVSSPYDFAMDSSLGTYICTFDFTETALEALVNLLVGDVYPTGTLPGSLRRNRKVHQSKQHWLVETWDSESDAEGLGTLLKSVQQEVPATHRSVLAGSTPNSFQLDMATDSHFVIRNSSTQAVYGFCSTYYFSSVRTGVIGLILVDPGRRSLSIGNSLHARAIKTLLQRPGITRIQLGSRIPSVFLGLPSSNSTERKRLRQWFAGMKWSNAISRPLCSLLLRNLQSWVAPDSFLQSLKQADVDFDLVQGSEEAPAIVDFVSSSSRQGVREMYELALADSLGSAVLRVKRNSGGFLLGTVILYTTKSTWADKVPGIKNDQEVTGGISSPVISPSAAGEISTLFGGLIVLGVRQHQKQKATMVLLDCVCSGTMLFKLSHPLTVC